MKQFFIIFCTFLSLLSHSALASEVRMATNLIDANISGPDVYVKQYNGKNFWVLTAPDADGIQQVYYQWSDATTTAGSTSPLVQLTFNDFHASKAKFGSEVNDLHYAPTAADTSVTCEGLVFYYLADDTDADTSKDIRMGCIAYSNLATEPTTVNFDVKLTGYDSATTFDVKDYDVSRAGRATTLNIYSPTDIVASYPVVFTDSSNALHMLMFDKSIIYGNSDNITGSSPPIVYDYTDTAGGYIYVWNSTSINTGAEYFNPALDPWANSVIFSVKTSASPYKQLGTINIAGRGLTTITNFNSNVVNPSWHGDFHPLSTLSNRVSLDLFFELRDNSAQTSRLAYLPVFTSGLFGTMSWCNTAAYLTDETYKRTNLRTDFGSSTLSNPETVLLWQQEMPDGNRDLYQAKVDISFTPAGLYCNGINTRTDGTVMTFDTTKTRKFYDLVKGVKNITQLTCMEDNTNAAFLQTVYRDASFAETTSSLDFMDVVFQRDYSDGSGEVIGHVYDSEVASAECTDNCFETADGSPVIDINLFRDGDGLADSCENPSCQQMVNVDLYGDADGDTVANNRDNCPCDVNTDQADADNDHWGDVCDIEYDECGTVDTDADGVGDICDACPEDADLTDLAYDNDGNGALDSCIQTNPCGTVDTDHDGTMDMCDACPSDASLTELAYDIDGNGTMDSCIATPCGTVDSDGDGVFDNCDACPNNPESSTLTFDVNADGLIDSCETVIPPFDVQENVTSPSGGVTVGGGLLDGLGCSLNEQAQASQSSSQIGLLFGVAFSLMALAQARQKAKQHDK